MVVGRPDGRGGSWVSSGPTPRPGADRRSGYQPTLQQAPSGQLSARIRTLACRSRSDVLVLGTRVAHHFLPASNSSRLHQDMHSVWPGALHSPLTPNVHDADRLRAPLRPANEPDSDRTLLRGRARTNSYAPDDHRPGRTLEPAMTTALSLSLAHYGRAEHVAPNGAVARPLPKAQNDGLDVPEGLSDPAPNRHRSAAAPGDDRGLR